MAFEPTLVIRLRSVGRGQLVAVFSQHGYRKIAHYASLLTQHRTKANRPEFRNASGHYSIKIFPRPGAAYKEFTEIVNFINTEGGEKRKLETRKLEYEWGGEVILV